MTWLIHSGPNQAWASQPGRLISGVLPSLDTRISLPTLIRLFPLAFIIHDLEEVLTVEKFWRRHRTRLPLPAAVRRQRVSTRQFAAAVACLFGMVSLIAERAARAPGNPSRVSGFHAGVAVLFANAFTHTGQSLLLRRYTPGLITALAVSLPYSAYTLRRLAQAGLLERASALPTLREGALLIVPTVVISLWVGKLMDCLFAVVGRLVRSTPPATFLLAVARFRDRRAAIVTAARATSATPWRAIETASQRWRE